MKAAQDIFDQMSNRSLAHPTPEPFLLATPDDTDCKATTEPAFGVLRAEVMKFVVSACESEPLKKQSPRSSLWGNHDNKVFLPRGVGSVRIHGLEWNQQPRHGVQWGIIQFPFYNTSEQHHLFRKRLSAI